MHFKLLLTLSLFFILMCGSNAVAQTQAKSAPKKTVSATCLSTGDTGYVKSLAGGPALAKKLCCENLKDRTPAKDWSAGVLLEA